MTDHRDDLVTTMIERATAAGDAAGVYLSSASVVLGPDGPTEPVQIVVRFDVGERAFLAPVDTEAIRQRRIEDDLLARAFDPTGDDLRAELDGMEGTE